MKKAILAVGLWLSISSTASASDVCPESAYPIEDGAYMLAFEIDIPAVDGSVSSVAYASMQTKGNEKLSIIVGQENGVQYWDGQIEDANGSSVFDLRSSLGNDGVITGCELYMDTPYVRIIEARGYYTNNLSRLGNFDLRMTVTQIW